ncbi:MAG TPA: methyltransferase domain-containing protein [Gemmatimonadales bacterium]|nr:methyltransferase domain-containing protein [Gemmatimonadales bacterium]
MNALEPAAFGIELLDDPEAAPADVGQSLRNIARANRWLGGAAAVRYGLDRALGGRRSPGDGPLTLLDVGTGSGDLPRMAGAWAAARGLDLRPIGLERCTAAARLAHADGLLLLAGDGGCLPLRDRSVDVVLLSQVAHHFAPAGIIRLLRECDRVARRAVIVADLRRSPFAALGWRVASLALGFDPNTCRDGLTSLRRGFSTASLGALLAEAGIRAPVIRRPGARLVAVWEPAA